MRRLYTILVSLIITTSLTPIPIAQASDDISIGQWYTKALNLSEAQAISSGEGARVVVLDSGVDSTHPDLEGSIEAGANFGGGKDDTGLVDHEGHGTSLAGLIVGHGRVRGVAPAAKVVSITNAIGPHGRNGDAQGIDWAVAHKLNIICIASGAFPDQALDKAIERALAADVIIVVAAGNKPTDVGVGYPATVPGVIAVGGTMLNGKLSSVSVSGPDIALVAPSDHVSVAYRDHGYAVTTGTSNSSALVAGAVALIRGKYPQLSAQQVTSALTTTAIDEGQPGRDFDYGYGRIDIVAALKKAGTMQPDHSGRASPPGPTSASTSVTATSPEPRSGPSAGVLAAIIIGGLLAAAMIIALIVGPFRRT